MQEKLDVVVIGGGTAGLVTASGCARLGRKVALIEKHALGGDCLWTGCVPTKSLVATGKLIHQMRNAAAWGLDPHDPAIEARSIMDSMREAQRITSKHDDPEKFRKLGIDVIEGEARLVARDRVAVGDRELVARDIVLATGARTAVPPIEGLAEAGFLDHASFLETNSFPRSILILGGGYIGIEFAQLLRRFGCEVIVVEMLDDIINKEDASVIVRVRRMLEAEGIAIHTGFAVKSIRREGSKIARLEAKTGQGREIAADEIFVASGRRGNIEGLGLENAGVKTERSFVTVDRFLRTSVPRVWACGDIHGGLQFTHVAAFEAVKLVRNMLFPGKSPISYDHIPWTLFTDPEVAHLGMTEAEARKEFGAVRVYECEMAEVDRAVVDRTTGGFVKIICNPRGRIAGAHIVSVNASALMTPLVLARKRGMKIGEVAQLVSPYPSLADAVQKAAAAHYQQLSRTWVGALGRRLAALSQ
jgi:pyruvate/2-oxoglutarate dehydrogenase complex dihydrolipoamide dehydrogenase (E3) component